MCALLFIFLIHPDYGYLFISTTTSVLLLVTTATQIYRRTTKICYKILAVNLLNAPVEKMKASHPQKNLTEKTTRVNPVEMLQVDYIQGS